MARARFQQARGRAIGQQIPWWLISFILHAAVLVVLAQIEMAVPVQKQKIKITTEFVPVLETLRPVRKRNVFNKAAQEAANRGAATSFHAEGAALSKSVEVMTIGAVDVGSTIDDLFGKSTIGSFENMGQGGGKLAEVQSKAPQTYEEVLDEYAQDVIEACSKRGKKLLVVLLVDRSRSIWDDRQQIGQKIDSIAKTLKGQMSDAEAKRLQWAVVSFGEKARILMRPTPALMKVKNVMMKDIKFDESGIENMLGAIRYTMGAFKSLTKRAQLFIAVVSDEPGDDCEGPKGAKLLEAVRQQLLANKVRLYVFGREANFSYPKVYSPVYDTDGRVIAHAWADGGPETPAQELLPFCWLFNSNARTIPSGFGMYAQTLLARDTKGTYFILSDVPSRYDEEKLGKDYAPEVIPLPTYLERQKASRVRRVIQTIAKDWSAKYRVSGGFYRLDHLDEDARAQCIKAQKAHQWVRAARKELEKSKGRDKWNRKRWEANRDLTVAQLAKFEFHYRQYWLCLDQVIRRGWPYPKKGERFNRFYVHFDAPADKPPGGRSARKEKAEAEKLLKKVIEEHKDTPWAELAARDIKSLRPYRVRFYYWEQGRTRPKI